MAQRMRHEFNECSFCHKHQQDVRKLIAGPEFAPGLPKVMICDECVEVCNDIIAEDESLSPPRLKPGEIATPKNIKSFLDKYVIGQDGAKRAMAIAYNKHLKREALRDPDVKKTNILLTGPTGTGKTLLAQTLARLSDRPFAMCDATSLTEAGYVGDDVENILLRLIEAAGGDIEKAQRGIIYLDEVDKLARRGENTSITRDVSGEGVQQALLKILEGTVASVPAQGGRKHPHGETLRIDTTNILFICGGAFVGLDKIIEGRTKKEKTVGFQASLQREMAAQAGGSALEQIEPRDLEKFGMIPEFIGRLPVITSTAELSEEQLMRILTDPPDAALRQAEKLLKMDKVQLTATEDGKRAIVREALKRGTGARGLPAVMEKVLEEASFEGPDSGGGKIVIDAAYVDRVMRGAENNAASVPAQPQRSAAL